MMKNKNTFCQWNKSNDFIINIEIINTIKSNSGPSNKILDKWKNIPPPRPFVKLKKIILININKNKTQLFLIENLPLISFKYKKGIKKKKNILEIIIILLEIFNVSNNE